MSANRSSSPRFWIVLLLALGLLAAACGDDDATTSSGTPDGGSQADEGGDGGADDGAFDGTLVIGAIPDQDPEVLARNYGLLAEYLSEELGVDVEFRPVTEYDAAVTAFRVGDLDLVWFGGLTGVQARLQVDGAAAIAQRDIDEEFTSVFIAGTDTGIEPIDDVSELTAFAGKSFTFGSESSTSGRLMPQSFLSEAGVELDDFAGEVGFSGSHDKTIALVESGTFEAGALNSQVWRSRVEDGEVDTEKVQLIFETPTYYDYHWVARPELGGDLQQRVVEALAALDPSDPEEAEILEFFGADAFIETDDANYADIEKVGRDIGKIDG